jgi:hypothetical protein
MSSEPSLFTMIEGPYRYPGGVNMSQPGLVVAKTRVAMFEPVALAPVAGITQPISTVTAARATHSRRERRAAVESRV